MTRRRFASTFRSSALAMRAIAFDLGHLCSDYVSERQVSDRGLMPAELNELWWELVTNDPNAPSIGIASWGADSDGAVHWETGTGRLSVKVTDDSVTLSCWAGSPAPTPIPSKTSLIEQIEEEYWGPELLADSGVEGNLAGRVIYILVNGQWAVDGVKVNEALVRGREDRISFISHYDSKVFDGACRQHLGKYSGILFEGEAILLEQLDAIAAYQEQVETIKRHSMDFARRAAAGEFDDTPVVSEEAPGEYGEPAVLVWYNVKQLVSRGEIEPYWGWASNGHTLSVLHEPTPRALAAAYAASQAWQSVA